MNENCLVGRPGGCGGLVKIAAPPVDILVSCNYCLNERQYKQRR